MSLPSDDFVAQTVAATRVPVVDAMRTVRSPKRSTRYRVARNVIIAAAVIAALTAGGIAVSRTLQGTIDHSATCYQHASLDSHQQPMAGSGETSDDPVDPLWLCGQAWELGLFESGHRPDGKSHPVPELVACELPDGTAAVFPLEGHPADGFCGRLVLGEWHQPPPAP